MIAAATPQQAQAIARAAYTVATTGGTTPLSGADRRAITSAMVTVFGQGDPVDVDRLTPIDSVDLVRVVEDDALRLALVQVLAVIAFLDGVVEQGKLRLVLDMAAPSTWRPSSSTPSSSSASITSGGSPTT